MLALILVACSQQVVVTPDQSECVGFDYANPAESTVTWEPLASGALVSRSNVLLPESGLTFSPEFEIGSNELTVREFWTDPAEKVEFCYTPSVLIEDFRGQMELHWYIGDDDIPVTTLLLEG